MELHKATKSSEKSIVFAYTVNFPSSKNPRTTKGSASTEAPGASAL